MKNLFVAVVAVLVVGTASITEAANFTLQSYSVALRTTGSGLQVSAEKLLADPFDFELNALDPTQTEKLFKISTSEQTVEADDWQPYSIAVKFNFSRPEPGFGGSAQGLTGAISFFGHELAYVAWDNPLTLAFGTTGLMQIFLSHETFGVPGSATVNVTFKLVREDTGAPVSVPEPGLALLMGIAVAGATRIARRRHA